MSLKKQIDVDLKTAMLAGDKTLVTTLRGLKSAILYAEVAKGSREKGLSDTEIEEVFSKEAKKRQESADLYMQGGNKEKAEAELTEKKVIDDYLPTQLSEQAIKDLVEQAISQVGATSSQQMGQVIGMVKQKAGTSADGAVIARFAKERLG